MLKLLVPLQLVCWNVHYRCCAHVLTPSSAPASHQCLVRPQLPQDATKLLHAHTMVSLGACPALLRSEALLCWQTVLPSLHSFINAGQQPHSATADITEQLAKLHVNAGVLHLVELNAGVCWLVAAYHPGPAGCD